MSFSHSSYSSLLGRGSLYSIGQATNSSYSDFTPTWAHRVGFIFPPHLSGYPSNDSGGLKPNSITSIYTLQLEFVLTAFSGGCHCLRGSRNSQGGSRGFIAALPASVLPRTDPHLYQLPFRLHLAHQVPKFSKVALELSLLLALVPLALNLTKKKKKKVSRKQLCTSDKNSKAALVDKAGKAKFHDNLCESASNSNILSAG